MFDLPIKQKRVTMSAPARQKSNHGGTLGTVVNETNFDGPFADFSEPITFSSTALRQLSGKSLTSSKDFDKKMIQRHENILRGLESDACNSMRKKDVRHILYEVCCQLCADLFI